jgi:PHD/YefM family antitoxin component YafN of YafNO toxin-antitoxin module
MFNDQDYHALTAFLNDHESHLKRLEETGRPEVLTVDGEAKLVVQDAAAYEALLEALDILDTARILQERIKSVKRGEPGVPADTVFENIRQALKTDAAKGA